MIQSENGNLFCLGYASFVEAKENHFRRWFTQLEKDIDFLSKNLTENSDRLAQLQHGLINLLDYLDPDCIRLPNNTVVKSKSWASGTKVMQRSSTFLQIVLN